MPFVVTCGCGQQMTVDEAYAGRQVSCIQCGALVSATAEASQAATGAPYQPPEPQTQPTYRPAPPAPAPVAPQDVAPGDAEEALPPPPAVPPAQTSGKRRRTFVSSWAKDIADNWAEEHPEEIASDHKPSTAVCVIAGIMTILIGAYNTAVFGLLLAGILLTKLGGLQRWTEGRLLLAAISILAALGLWTLISGATCIAARRRGAAAAVPLNLAWSFLALFTIFQVRYSPAAAPFWASIVGVVLFCCLGTVLSVFASRQAGRYQLWLVRKQQEAEGSLVS